MKTYEELIDEASIYSLIKGFDVHYGRSDDPKVFWKGQRHSEKISAAYAKLNPAEQKKAAKAMVKHGMADPIKAAKMKVKAKKPNPRVKVNKTDRNSLENALSAIRKEFGK